MIVASLLLIVGAVLLLSVGLAGGSNAFLAGSIIASLLAAIALILAGRRSADRLAGAPDRSAEAEGEWETSARPDRVSVADLLEADTERVNVPAARRNSERLERVTVGAGTGAGTGSDTDVDGDPDDAPGAGGHGGARSVAERPVIPAQQTVTGRGPSTDDEPPVPEGEWESVGESTVADERPPADGSADPDERDSADGSADGDERDSADGSADGDERDSADGSADGDERDSADGSADGGERDSVDGGERDSADGDEWNSADGSADGDEGEPADEPPPQASSPADAARVARMTAPVYVIDGRPRYHLRSCAHLLGRQCEALPVYEAVELEFTPCGLCRPDTRILAGARR